MTVGIDWNSLNEPPPALQMVQSGFDYHRNVAEDMIRNAQSSLWSVSSAVAYVTPPVLDFQVPPDIQTEYGSFLRPMAPTMPDLPDVQVTVPSAPVLSTITVAPLEPAPSAPDFGGMTYNRPAPPNAPVPNRPTDIDVQLVDVVIPPAPTHVLPADPVLYALNLPPITDLVVPEFTGVRPVLDLTAPVRTFDWQYAAYDDSLIQTIKGQLSAMTLQGLALPAAIEQAIFDRARGREDILSAQQVQEASDSLAGRGLRQPAGLLTRALERIRTNNRQQSSAASRDLAIKMAELNVEAIKFAIAQAIGLESAMLQNSIAQNDLLLRAAQAVQGIEIDVFNTQVVLHNAAVDAFKTDAQVFGERIRALQAQADVLKTRIDAQKVVGDVNESLVRAYGERIRAISALAEVYRTNVEAAKARGEINVQRLEQARLRLQAYSTDVEAWGKLQDAYRTQVDAETGSAKFYETLGNVYGRQVEAWKTKGDAEFARARTEIDQQNQLLERFRADLQGVQIDSQTKLAAVEAITRVFATRAGIFAAEGQVSASESAAHDRTAQLRIEGAKLRADVALKNLDVQSNFALKRVDQAIETNRGAAQIWSQLAASALSGVNFGASFSGSQGVSTSFDYNYDMNP